jgi:hypothetical protein
MDLNQLKGLSQEEAFKWASELSGVPVNILDALWDVESGRGRAMLSHKGARGHFQLMPATQALFEKELGVKINPDDFHESLFLAAHHLQADMRREKGDIESALRAYNNGPKWREQKDPRGENAAYAGKIFARAGGRPATPEYRPSQDTGLVRPDPVDIAQDLARLQRPLQDNGIADVEAGMQAERDMRVREDETSGLATAWGDGRVNMAVNLWDRRDKPEADHSFNFERWDGKDAFLEEVKPRNLTELEFIRENLTGAESAEWVKSRLERDRQADEDYAVVGPWRAIGGQLAVGLADPTGLAIGMGLGKVAGIARVGARAAALAGRSGARATAGRTAAVGATEGAVGNVIWEGAQDAMGEVKTLADYGLAAAFGGTLGLGTTIPGMVRGARDAEFGAALRDIEAIDASLVAREAELATGARGLPPVEQMVEDVRTIVTDRQPGVVRATRQAVVPLDALEIADTQVAPSNPPEAVVAPVRAAEPANPAGAPGAEPVAQPTLAEVQGRIDALTAEISGMLDSLNRKPRSGTKRGAKWDELWTQREELKRQRDTLSGEAAAPTDRTKAPADPTAQAPTGPRGEALRQAVDGDGNRVNTVARETLAEALENARQSVAFKMKDDTRWARLAEMLLEHGDRRVLDGTNVWYSPGARGVWRPALDAGDMPEIVTPGDASGGAGMNRQTIPVLVHEAVHALTVSRIKAVAQNLDGVTPALRKAVRDLNEVYKEFRKGVERDGLQISRNEDGGGDAYGALNILEFAAQALMDLPTQRRLLAMPSTKKYSFSSLWGQLWDAIKRIITGEGKIEGTAMADVLTQLEVIIRSHELPDGIDLSDVGPGLAAGPSPQAHSAANVKFVQRMYGHARDFLAANPIDSDKLTTLANQATSGGVRDVVVSDGLKAASSKNPIVQMLSSLVAEVTTGAAGRRSTAAIQQHIYHYRIVGTSVLEFDSARMRWSKANGGGYFEAAFKGEKFKEFDRLVAEEIHMRRNGIAGGGDPYVVQAADALQAMYQRSLDTQKGSATLGSHYLPPDSVGYMPQALNGDALRAASPQEQAELSEFLASHWQGVYGWDHNFAATFADYYLRRARLRAAGQNGVDFVATESPSAAVHDTLEMMKLEMRDMNSMAKASLDQVGAQPQNKKRLDVDMLHVLPSGRKVMDYYNTDALNLARQHARRVAGASALADFNVLGQRGVNNLLRAIDDAPAGLEATPEERDAVDRMFSEFLGVPYSGEYRNRFAAGAGALTRLLRMGGLAFTQLGEYGNAMHHLGLGATMRSIGTLPSMIKEIRKGLDGQPVHNAWLESIDQWSGYTLGTENFLNTTAFDANDELLRAYGKGQSTVERLLQAGNYAQAKVSFFRGLHAAQHRAITERIVNRAVNYLSDPNAKAENFLDDMGFNAEMRDALRNVLPQAVKRDAAGNAVGFDLHALGNAELMEDFVQAVQRGAHQIIQGTFIGERGAWAHNDVYKVLGQLRTFGLTATEKQWARSRMVNGAPGVAAYGYAAGVLLGQMAFVLPIYLARLQVNAAGRPDREEYLEKQLAPASLIQALMNYSTNAGLAGDAFDQLASVAGGWNDDAKAALGTRSFGTGVGGLVPAFGTVDAYMRLMQGKGDAAFALKQLPMSNLPYLQPLINIIREE